MYNCVCVHVHIYKYIAFSDIKMQVALTESQEQNVCLEKQIWGGDDCYLGFVWLENCTSSTIGWKRNIHKEQVLQTMVAAL